MFGGRLLDVLTLGRLVARGCVVGPRYYAWRVICYKLQTIRNVVLSKEIDGVIRMYVCNRSKLIT
jgi:hypothetical protein